MPPLALSADMVPAASASRRAIVVLGMHRSGTSAVAGCLQRLGVDFGPRLMPPSPDNPRGYYEHIDIVNLHDRLLLAAGSHWDDTEPRPPEWLSGTDTSRFRADLRELLHRDFGSAPLWGIKDPRLCRLLAWWQPLWAEMQTQPLFVIVLRDPREVAASLARRDGFSPAKAYLLWLQHVLEAERATRRHERVFVDFAAFVTDCRQALAPVAAWLGQAWPAPLTAAAAGERFVDSALPRASHVPAEGGSNPPLWVEEIDTALRKERRTGVALFAELDRVAAQAEAAHSLYGSAREHQDDLSRQLAALQKQARWYEEEWQKARRRWEDSRKRLVEGDQEGIIPTNRIIEPENTISRLRKQVVSGMRKTLGSLRRFLRRLLGY